jgi:hypothetical protein
MSTIKSIVKGGASASFLAEFQPLRTLWEGRNAPYPSEYSARWEVRKLRDTLVREQAAAFFRGRLMVHPQRFAKVVEQAGIEQFANRIAKHEVP